jgi:hypothetical protein
VVTEKRLTIFFDENGLVKNWITVNSPEED